MKKIVFVFALCAMFITSCSNNEEVVEKKEETTKNVENLHKIDDKAYLELSGKIDHLKQSKEFNIARTRGFWGWLKRITRTVFCDAVGAVVGSLGGPGGSVMGAISASAFSAFNEKNHNPGQWLTRSAYDVSMTNSASVAMQGLIVPAASGRKASITDSIGYVHNEIFVSLANNSKDANAWLDKDYDSFKASLKQQILKDPILKKCSAISTKDLVSANVDIIEEKVASWNNDQLSSSQMRDEAILMAPTQKDQINVLYDIICGIEELDGNAITEDYIHEVYKLIESSSLSAKDKESLKMGVSVGFASSRLWNPEAFSEK